MSDEHAPRDLLDLWVEAHQSLAARLNREPTVTELVDDIAAAREAGLL